MDLGVNYSIGIPWFKVLVIKAGIGPSRLPWICGYKLTLQCKAFGTISISKARTLFILCSKLFSK